MEDKKGITIFALGLDAIFMFSTGITLAHAPKSSKGVLIALIVAEAIMFICFIIYLIAGRKGNEK